jgi:hypothetical protein
MNGAVTISAAIFLSIGIIAIILAVTICIAVELIYSGG